MLVTEDYRDVVEQTGQDMLDHTLRVGASTARDDLLNGEAVNDGPKGTFILTSGGRTRWRGDTLAGGLTALMCSHLPMPVRVWHTNPEGERRLVVIHGARNGAGQ